MHTLTRILPGRVILLFILLIINQLVQTTRSDSDNSARVHLLNHLLDGYDKRLQPSYITGTTTVVSVQIFVVTIDSISEASMDYKLSMFLRQRWNDRRLAFNATDDVDVLELDLSVMDKVWVPDMYVVSEKKADFHDVTVPNRLMHIYSNGDVQYSLRVTGTYLCPMDLLSFPFDKQYCKMELESYGYSANNLLFRWHDSAVRKSDTLELPQYDLTEVTPYVCDRPYYGIIFTCIGVHLTFIRNYGYYLIQIYIPSILIVILSWVNFWLDPESVPARISLGLLTVLTMTTQLSGARANLPRVSYVKAIDVWMAFCLTFVFAGLLEFALVNVLARRERRRKTTDAPVPKKINAKKYEVNGETNASDCEHAETDTIPSRCFSFRNMAPGIERARVVDKVSRYLFPVVFVIFNLIYWIYYLVVFVSDSST